MVTMMLENAQSHAAFCNLTAALSSQFRVIYIPATTSRVSSILPLANMHLNVRIGGCRTVSCATCAILGLE